ncbi:MAG: deoxyguanosinetriphosphate triphosphohydrolase [Desulfobulbaceae bacterium]|nr:deoxyguanosinetriphosphate triphosphohydrolase [Desulfobulbaceae bacterium]
MPIHIREETTEREIKNLSPHACLSKNSKGRLRPEDECPIRVCFQRDRDRIIHSKTFRRLTHKTQVFLAPTGDHYRTRLTHALEVAQIARTIGVALRLNGHLIEAIALGHDLGHTPFGHAGESMLNELHPGGFRHYEQSLRIVDILEKKGRGLNLTHEVRDGILKHSKGRKKILPENLKKLPKTLEGQVVRVSDIIAYVNHDLDDAVRAGIIKEQDYAHITRNLGQTNSERIGAMVRDIIIRTLETDTCILDMSEEVLQTINELRNFLFEKVYLTSQVHHDFIKAMKIVRELYEYFLENASQLAPGKNKDYPSIYAAETTDHRKVCDFVAGMTDRYALDLYTDIFFPKPWSVV